MSLFDHAFMALAAVNRPLADQFQTSDYGRGTAPAVRAFRNTLPGRRSLARWCPWSAVISRP